MKVLFSIATLLICGHCALGSQQTDRHPRNAACVFRIESTGRLTPLAGMSGGQEAMSCFTEANLVAIDGSGSLYMMKPAGNQVYEVIVSGPAGSEGRTPVEVTVDASGDLYIAGPDGRAVWIVTADGEIRSIETADGAAASTAVVVRVTMALTTAAPQVLAASSPTLMVLKKARSSFVQGHPGAEYSISIRNTGLEPTAGSMTVTDDLPASMALRYMQGQGWECSANTCTRADSLAPGGTFPAIVVSVNINANAPSQVTNTANVSGGGAPDATHQLTSTVSPGPPDILPAPRLISPANGATNVSAVPKIAWNSVSGASGYQFLVADDPYFFGEDPYSVDYVSGVIAHGLVGSTSATEYNISNLHLGVTYYWRVRAKAAGKGGEWSVMRSFTLADEEPLPAPTPLTPQSAGRITEMPIRLTWTAVTAASGYRVMVSRSPATMPREPDATSCGDCVLNVTTSSPSYSIPALESGYVYSWQVRAFNSSGGGYWSYLPTFALMSSLVAPQVTSPSDGAAGVPLSVDLSWKAVYLATDYRVMLATKADSLPTNPYVKDCQACVVNATSTDTAYKVSSLQPRKTYYWQVRGFSSVHGGPWSPVRSFTTADSPLAAPVLLSPADGAAGVIHPVELRWNSVSSATGYRLAVAETVSALPTTPETTVCSGCLITTTLAATSISLSTLEVGKKYYWKVAAYNGTSQGYWSGAYNFTVGLGPSVRAGGFVNAGSYSPVVSPGSLAAVFGDFGISSPAQAAALPLPVELGGLTLEFAGGVKAPLIFTSQGQVNAQVPWELAGQSQSNIAVVLNGRSGPPQSVQLATFSPAIFSMNSQGNGQGAILNESYQLVDASNPATAGRTVIQIFCTGLGPVTNQPASGAAAPLEPLAITTIVPTVTIGGAQAEVQFHGLVPGLVGFYQVNALVPSTSTIGAAVPVVISVGETTSNTVMIAVQTAPIGA